MGKSISQIGAGNSQETHTKAASKSRVLKCTSAFFFFMRYGCVVFLLFCLSGCSELRQLRDSQPPRGGNGKPPPSGWQQLAPDLELRAFSVAASHAMGGKVEVIALRTDPSHVHVVSGSTLDAAQWRTKEKTRAVINGGYFDENGKPLGLRVQNGKKIGSLHPADWGVFYIRRGKARVLHTRDFAREHPKLNRITQAIQCGPRLVVKGRTTDLKPQTARRTGVGITPNGKVVLAVADGTLSFQEWAKLWADAKGLNCRDALNLDGGGSTQLSLKIDSKSVEVPGHWPVPDAIVIR